MKADPETQALWRRVVEELNFYRIHWLYFTLTPLILSAVFFASNGQFRISYTDALFTCVSAMTGTGLATIDLSSLTGWQQSILFVLNVMGSPALVAWVAVLVRRRYFMQHLETYVRTEFERTRTRDVWTSPTLWVPRGRGMTRRPTAGANESKSATLVDRPGEGGARRLPEEMVRGLDADGGLGMTSSPAEMEYAEKEKVLSGVREVGASGSEEKVLSSSPERMATADLRAEEEREVQELGMTRAPQVQFELRQRRPRPTRGKTIMMTADPKHQDDSFGGFGDPIKLANQAFKRLMPKTHARLERKMTMPAVSRLVSNRGDAPSAPGATAVSYLSFEAHVGRNSRFHGLSDEDCEELGGVEFRALTALVWLVPLFFFSSLLIPFAVVAPYMSIPRWRDVFLPPQQHRPVNPVWYSAFEVVGAWANTGMSLVDQNLVPFQQAYPLLVMLIYVGIAGNTGFPIFLRFLIWIIYRICPQQSQLKETLHFLLDHPRRCFIYLFPSRQTWFLFIVLISLNVTDWALFLILDIGNPAIEAIPVGVRVLLGVVQAVAVRLAGFATVSISALAPAVKILYLVMMYVSAYPIAMSIRATNVYEEKSLGIFDDESDDDESIEDEADYPKTESRVSIMGRYLGRHVRRQLAFDMWWLGGALFLICIVERGNIDNPDNATWFNLFNIIFEMVSAYSTVGLSLGIPTENYSFSGAMHVLSKVLIMAVMLRGRHRGLPVALDRAVLLPKEFLQRASDKARQIKREEARERYLARKREREKEESA